MKVFVSVKQLGKKKSVLASEPLELPTGIENLRDLINCMVTQNVIKYNENIGKTLEKVFTAEELNDNIEAGAVKFGGSENTNVQSLEKALDNALLSFEDGIYKVFVNEKEIESLDTALELKEGAALLFLKLTFLRGSFY